MASVYSLQDNNDVLTFTGKREPPNIIYPRAVDSTIHIRSLLYKYMHSYRLCHAAMHYTLVHNARIKMHMRALPLQYLCCYNLTIFAQFKSQKCHFLSSSLSLSLKHGLVHIFWLSRGHEKSLSRARRGLDVMHENGPTLVGPALLLGNRPSL